jgi:hypothetical protein
MYNSSGAGVQALSLFYAMPITRTRSYGFGKISRLADELMFSSVLPY